MQEALGRYLITGLLVWKPRSKQTKQYILSLLYFSFYENYPSYLICVIFESPTSLSLQVWTKKWAYSIYIPNWHKLQHKEKWFEEYMVLYALWAFCRAIEWTQNLEQRKKIRLKKNPCSWIWMYDIYHMDYKNCLASEMYSNETIESE